MTGDDDATIEWPLAGDPAICWRTMRDVFERFVGMLNARS
jgi:hypothetical protein